MLEHFRGLITPTVLWYSIPLYIAFRIYHISVVYKSRKQKFNLWHEVFLFIFYMFVLGLLNITLDISTFKFSNIKVDNELQLMPFKTIRRFWPGLWGTQSVINIFGNIIVFTPVGFFVCLLWNDRRAFTSALICAFLLSLFIEWMQVFIPGRYTDIDDLLLNTLGGILGAVIFIVLSSVIPKLRNVCKVRH